MKSNLHIKLAISISLLSPLALSAQNLNENALSFSYSKKDFTTTTHYTSSPMEVVDYPTVSYPETSEFTIERAKAFYRLSWQVLAKENLLYTEVQSSTDGKTFVSVGVIMNDGAQKSNNFDYFIPSDNKTGTMSFRVVQYGLNNTMHVSDVLSLK